jgi:hypothetical protein
MKRLIGVGAVALLLFAAACAPQGPAFQTQLAAVTFQPVGPAGYCLSDESDRIGMSISQTHAKLTQSRERILAIFRPCDERLPQPRAMIVSVNRIIFWAAAPPTVGPGQRVMDRQMYVALFANPKLTELLNQRYMPMVRDALAKAPEGLTASDIRYLGSDDAAVYTGTMLNQDNLGPLAPPHLKGAIRTVFAHTVVGGVALTAAAMNVTAGREPEDWTVLQQAATQAIHSTIAAAEKPSQTAPAQPVRQPPAKPDAAGLST